ncbi:MAG: WecB/TagA/CpsF family glycosyltransferase [Ignavibacterium sp.]|jgi:N-acetylglucosaminyldiphosphoundecaprenol N-acetyl-beta-D-mannosaminyltransferase
MHNKQRSVIVSLNVERSNYDEAVSFVIARAIQENSAYICVANTHMVMEAHDNPTFRDIVNSADLIVPDGMPLVWGLKLLNVPDVERVYGPALTIRLCEEAERQTIPVGFFGGEVETLAKLKDKLLRRFPRIRIAYMFSPPFRELSRQEDDQIVAEIKSSGTRILFVGLGCPKQEQWMATHCRKLNTVMLGVGAAFDFLAGTKPQAPRWMQVTGLEWAFRLTTEPKRLWRRYLLNNPRFLYLFAKQLLVEKLRWYLH